MTPLASQLMAARRTSSAGVRLELKHGRISMLATMGYITPEITGKFPGYLSPSADLKFADIPNGLGAISKVPPLGWAQIFAYAGFCELSQDQSPGTPASEGDFGFKVLTSSDPAEKNEEVGSRAGKRPTGHDGDHRHVLPGWPYRFSEAMKMHLSPLVSSLSLEVGTHPESGESSLHEI